MHIHVVQSKRRLNQDPTTPQASCNLYDILIFDVSVNGNKVDLSSEAVIDGTPTVYRWFTGNVNVDKNGNLQGEEFDVDAEYTVTNGVTTLKLTKRHKRFFETVS